jgi:pyruvate/2-oxoglutarate dehydrogenase complex dihydrolipoamide dehydrogenase (E3) component
MIFDVIVIGSGQAGVPLATRLASSGKRVLLAERGELGGTCVNTGCTPTKTMIASARAAHVARTADRLGVHAKQVEVDFGAVVARKDAIVRHWREGVSKRLEIDRLTVARGHARFVGERKVEVGGEAHSAETIVINVGARPLVPPIDGLSGVPWLDNATVMQLRELPAHLLVLGGGYIGCEFGQMFRRFGSRVTIVDQLEHLMGREDPEISSALEDVFRKEGVDLALGTKTARVSGRAGEIALRLANGKELQGSHLLVAVGRRPSMRSATSQGGRSSRTPAGTITACSSTSCSAARSGAATTASSHTRRSPIRRSREWA